MATSFGELMHCRKKGPCFQNLFKIKRKVTHIDSSSSVSWPTHAVRVCTTGKSIGSVDSKSQQTSGIDAMETGDLGTPYLDLGLGLRLGFRSRLGPALGLGNPNPNPGHASQP